MMMTITSIWEMILIIVKMVSIIVPIITLNSYYLFSYLRGPNNACPILIIVAPSSTATL